MFHICTLLIGLSWCQATHITSDFDLIAGQPSNDHYLSSERSFEGMKHHFQSPEKSSRVGGLCAENVCNACNSIFQVPSEFQEHMANVHQKFMPYMCSLCGKCYGSQSGLSLHMQAHDGKTYVCPVCDSKFSQKSTMKRHMKCMHNTNQCSVCKGIFRLGTEFNQHVLHCK